MVNDGRESAIIRRRVGYITAGKPFSCRWEWFGSERGG